MPLSISNEDTELALRYHEATKHSEETLRSNRHFLDWSNQPQPFKRYRNVESVPLSSDPAVLLGTTPPALDAIGRLSSDVQDQGAVERIPDLATLARVLYLAAGITKPRRYAGGELYFRAYSNTGALYHIDLYLVTVQSPGNLYNSRPFHIASIEPAGIVPTSFSAVIEPVGGIMDRKLYVGNLPQSANQQTLQDMFSQCGTVDSVNVITDRDTGRSKGFAFVEMSSNGEAQKAIQELNGSSIDGHEIKVNEAKPKAPRDDHRSGGYGGGGRGRGARGYGRGDDRGNR